MVGRQSLDTDTHASLAASLVQDLATVATIVNGIKLDSAVLPIRALLPSWCKLV